MTAVTNEAELVKAVAFVAADFLESKSEELANKRGKAIMFC
jgi:hypothetical protein